MKSADTAHAEHSAWYHAHHYKDLGMQVYASRLGMWLFLATEVLLFAGLFLGYMVYRWLYPEAFQVGSRQLNLVLGTVNTVVLITSSFTVAWATVAIKQGNRKLTVRLLLFTLLCAVGFLVIKFFEYQHKFHVGQLPGKWFQFEEMAHIAGSNLFFAVYFLTTGLHAFHVVVGMIVLAWAMIRTNKGKYNAAYNVPVELAGLYWHLVDLVWIFLFPLLYLI